MRPTHISALSWLVKATPTLGLVAIGEEEGCTCILANRRGILVYWRRIGVYLYIVEGEGYTCILVRGRGVLLYW